MDAVDETLLVLRRQYLQLLDPDFLSWPSKKLLRDAGAQQWLSRSMFSAEHNAFLPSDRYRYRVLKNLIAKIERAIEDPDEEEVSEDLMAHFSLLLASDIPSELIAVQQRSYVTYSYIDTSLDHGTDKTVTILERRNLISGSLTTGFRTWEAALHLSAYLWSEDGRLHGDGKNIIELGAGTGLLSLLCAKHLNANFVLSTDGDESVVDALEENAFLNKLNSETVLRSRTLRWGHSLQSLEREGEVQLPLFDMVLGADIIYDKTAVSPLVATLSMLFQANTRAKALIASVVRNEETFNTFLTACSRHAFTIEQIEFAAKPMHQQTGLFYATAMPLKILLIRPPAPA